MVVSCHVVVVGCGGEEAVCACNDDRLLESQCTCGSGRTTLARTKANTIAFAVPKDMYLAVRPLIRESGDFADNVVFLSTLPWLRGMLPEALVRFASFTHRRHHAKGAVLAYEGSGVTWTCRVGGLGVPGFFVDSFFSEVRENLCGVDCTPRP